MYGFVFLVIFFGLVLSYNVCYYLFFNIHLTVLSFIYVFFLEVVTFGMAYNMSSAVLILLVPPCHIKRLDRLERYPATALVCCVCDDADASVFRNLKLQQYPGLDIYLLDDSTTEASKQLVNAAGLPVLRRPDRIGFKAGNLNNWLFRHGWRYKYFFVADSDCRMDNDIVGTMVAYAEHPDNADIVLFETLLDCWNKEENLFVGLQTVTHPIAFRQRLGSENALQTNLSVGHNNLYRTEPVMDAGGFEERFLSEDHATAIKLLQTKRWRLITVPVVTYERLPANLNEYMKRQARYTVQTFQLMELRLKKLAVTIRLKLMNDCLTFAMPLLFVFGNVLLVAVNTLSISYWYHIHDLPGVADEILKTTYFGYWMILIVFPFLFQLLLAVKEKVSMVKYFISAFYGNFLFIAAAWSCLKRSFRYFVTKELEFNATGTEPALNFNKIVKAGWPIYIILSITLLSVILNPLYSLFNLVWIVPCFAAPAVVYYFQRKST